MTSADRQTNPNTYTDIASDASLPSSLTNLLAQLVRNPSVVGAEHSFSACYSGKWKSGAQK